LKETIRPVYSASGMMRMISPEEALPGGQFWGRDGTISEENTCWLVPMVVGQNCLQVVVIME